MSPKWFFSVVIAILAVFGIQQNQATAPNQEIAVQFTAIDIASEEAQNTILNVKTQLQLIGANNIKIQEGVNGILKISYYSDSDVASIKEILHNSDSVKLDYTSSNQNQSSNHLPPNKKSSKYNLDVYEIIDATNTDWGVEGISVVELKSENYRFFNPSIYAFTREIDAKQRLDEIALNVNRHIAIAIVNTFYKTPETRAGPIC